jgi:YHS domain-containing protein
MFRFILQFLLLMVLLLLLRAIVAKIFSPSSSGKISSRPQSEPAPAGELKKDPVCGTYVSAAGSVTRTVKGETIYFCSPECRDKYLVS